MFLYRSNDMSELADRLARVLAEPGPAILEPEVILIQSAGMQRWLSRELAVRHGVVANVSYPYPRSFLLDTLDAALGEQPLSLRYEREALSWEIFSLLRDLPPDEIYEPVRRNLAEDSDGTRRLLLAERLARLYDQYLTYRPRMILQWDAGRGIDDFQADLWQRITSRLGPHHLAARLAHFLRESSDDTIARAVPHRLSLVGGPGLPPVYLQVLSRISRVIPVHVFSFSVSREYFADLHPVDDPLAELGEGAHPLLVSLGKVGADYQFLIEQNTQYTDGPAEFRIPQPQSLLTALQSDIVQGERCPPEARVPSSFANDGSMTLESCHSRLREVEVLADRLLRWFAEDPTLHPEDVVVLTPDIEAYSPLVAAVFGARAGENPPIPYKIADRSEGATNAAARSLLLGLRLLPGRLKASAVLDFFQTEPVLHRFGVRAADLERIFEWVKSSGIRWGADGRHVASYGLQEREENTWSWGLRRLLLGYACADEGLGLACGVVPVDDVAASDADLLGRFADFVENLLESRARLQGGGLTPDEWESFLTSFCTTFLGQGSEVAWDVGVVQNAIRGVFHHARNAGVNEPLGLAAVLHLLEQAFDAEKPSTDFLSGGVTFCALLPLRTIPFRRVCVLGLDQAQFPRTDLPSALDKIADAPKRGDRTLRADDRFLFLEILLSARQRLALSYVGRSVQDNSECPPSVVVSELKQTLEDMVGGEDGTEACRAKGALEVVEHPLQPFSPRYFVQGSHLSSFDEQARRGALCLTSPDPRTRQPFVQGRLFPIAFYEPVKTSLDDLVRFWKNPAAAFLAQLDVVIDDEIEQFEDREPVSTDALSRWILGDALLHRQRLELPLATSVELGRGALPVGSAGDLLLSEVSRTASKIGSTAFEIVSREEMRRVEIAHRFHASLPNAQGQQIDVELELHGAEWLGPGTFVAMDYGEPDAKRQLALWLRHLALCAAGYAIKSKLVGRAAKRSSSSPSGEVALISFSPVEPARAYELLARACVDYLRGHCEPLRFFPKASLTYVETLHDALKKSSEEDAEQKAMNRAHRALYQPGSDRLLDSRVAQVFRDEPPLMSWSNSQRLQFAQLSQDIYEPLIAAREKEEL